jgi:hypothetical protein
LSTILKALRRLEEEKAANEEPRPLREQIARAPGALRSRRTGWIAAAIALVLGIGAGGGVIWWLFGSEGAKTEVVAAAPAPTAPPAPTPAPPARAPVPGPPDQAFASDVEIVERPDALPRLADSEPVQPGPVQPTLGRQRPVESSSAAERARQAALAEYQAAERARRGLPPEVVPPSPPQPAEPVPPIPAETPVARAVPPAPEPTAVREPVPAPVAQAPAPPAPAPAPAPAPKVAEAKPAPAKPPAPKPAAPRAAPEEAPPPLPPPSIAISVEKTQWHPLADRRIAWVRVPGEADSQRIVEGDVIDGLIVSAIEPSGVVFERDGEKIRRGLGQP